MNLIGNTCCSTVITTRFLKQPISNVFFYDVMDFNSMKNVVAHYDDIDFNKVSFELRAGFCYAIVDDLVTIFYPHYKYDDTYDYHREGGDLKSNAILKICENNYFKRLERMNEPPIFLVASRHQTFTRESADYSKEELLELLNLDVPHPLCVASEHEIYFKDSPNREFIYIDRPLISNGGQLAEFVMSRSKLLNRMSIAQDDNRPTPQVQNSQYAHLTN